MQIGFHPHKVEVPPIVLSNFITRYGHITQIFPFSYGRINPYIDDIETPFLKLWAESQPLHDDEAIRISGGFVFIANEEINTIERIMPTPRSLSYGQHQLADLMMHGIWIGVEKRGASGETLMIVYYDDTLYAIEETEWSIVYSVDIEDLIPRCSSEEIPVLSKSAHSQITRHAMGCPHFPTPFPMDIEKCYNFLMTYGVQNKYDELIVSNGFWIIQQDNTGHVIQVFQAPYFTRHAVVRAKTRFKVDSYNEILYIFFHDFVTGRVISAAEAAKYKASNTEIGGKAIGFLSGDEKRLYVISPEMTQVITVLSTHKEKISEGGISKNDKNKRRRRRLSIKYKQRCNALIFE